MRLESKRSLDPRRDVPKSFWTIVDGAHGDRAEFARLLARLTRDEMLVFFHAFNECQIALTSDEHVAGMDNNEDVVDDISSLVVSLGERVYFDVLAHPEKMPTAEDYAKSTGGFDGTIGQVFYERFGEEIVDAWWEYEAGQAALGDSTGLASASPAALPPKALDRFCKDLTALARTGELEEAFGREPEIGQIVDVLARRRRNPLLVGESGVGKTALIHAIARIAAGASAPAPLQDARFVQIDLGLLQADASGRVEIENRRSQIILEVKSSAVPVILVLDELRAVGADGAEPLKSALLRGDLRAIVAVLPSERAAHFAGDGAFERCFEVVEIHEPSAALAMTMVRGLRRALEAPLGVTITDEAERAAVELSIRYLPSRRLPDKALDLLDCAAARVAPDDGPGAGAARARVDRAAVVAVLAAWTGIPAETIARDDREATR